MNELLIKIQKQKDMGEIILCQTNKNKTKKTWCKSLYFMVCFRVTSLALGQSLDCPSASEVTLKEMGK